MNKLTLWLRDDLKKNNFYTHKTIFKHKEYSGQYEDHMPWKYIKNWFMERRVDYDKNWQIAMQCKINSNKGDSLKGLKSNMDFRKDWLLMLCEQ